MEKVRPFSLLIIIFSLALLSSYRIYYYFADDTNNLVEEEYYEIENNGDVSTNIVEKMTNKKEDKIKGILEIPKINLKKGFYDIDSDENNVNKNIYILKESIMPDNSNSTLFIAAHSGNSKISFFKNLNLLELDDSIIIHYKNHKYYYVVSDIYEMDKNGKITINKNVDETVLVLTTCSKKKDKQLIVVAKLLKII